MRGIPVFDAHMIGTWKSVKKEKGMKKALNDQRVQYKKEGLAILQYDDAPVHSYPYDAPWLDDKKFSGLYDSIRKNTIVDRTRCYSLYSLMSQVMKLDGNVLRCSTPKTRQRDPGSQQDYRTYRPVVERKISHFTRRPWGGRNARCRGHKRILTDIPARAGAITPARLTTLGLHHAATGWAIA